MVVVFSHAQQKKLDSLFSAFKVSKEDTGKIKLLNSISMILLKNNPDTTIILSGQAKKLGDELLPSANEKTQIVLQKNIALACTNIGLAYTHLGNHNKSEHYLHEALKQFERMIENRNPTVSLEGKTGKASVYNNLGSIFLVEANYEKAIEQYFNALKMYEQIEDKKGTASVMNNIGNVFYKQGNLAGASDYFQKSYELKKEIGDKKGMAHTLSNLANIYADQKKYDKAIEYYQSALKAEEEIDDKRGVAGDMSNIGNIYADQKKYDKALEYYIKAKKIKEEVDDKYGLAQLLNSIGSLYFHRHQYNEAIQNQLQALSLSREINAMEVVQSSYKGLSEIYSETKNFTLAYEYHQKYSEVKDSILNEESSKQIAEMQTKYETEKKEQQITLLNKDKELQDAQLNRQKIVIWSVVGGFLIVLILSIFIFRERKKSEKLLLNILPAETAKELKAKGKASPKYYESVTVMFTDFKGFTTIAEKLSAEELVSELDFLFKKFDEIISRYNIEKIKTIGDAYMCASGLPTANSNHAEEIVKAGIEIQNWMQEQNGKWSLRMGIHSGPVTAGVVGDKKFAYDIWGDTVNTASRMESSGEAGKINISGATYQILQGFENLEGLEFKFRGKIPAKNKGEIEMYFIEKI
ncbi:MAG: tetratricopeptide repeat protein [Bacteroidetes bacterium]|nr:tetratricopeptide repeat protein [Bacteroidota bacterium]